MAMRRDRDLWHEATHGDRDPWHKSRKSKEVNSMRRIIGQHQDRFRITISRSEWRTAENCHAPSWNLVERTEAAGSTQQSIEKNSLPLRGHVERRSEEKEENQGDEPRGRKCSESGPDLTELCKRLDPSLRNATSAVKTESSASARKSTCTKKLF